MKISELKQPYKRMAEYLGDENNTISHSLSNYFFLFYNKMHKGENPEITEEIKKHFPPDFDFSVDVNEKVNLHKELFDAVNVPKEIKEYKMTLFDKENQRKIEDENLQKRIYTQLAKDGKFDQLPDTCEFSEPVELEVWDNELMKPIKTNCMGKFMGKYVSQNGILWLYAQLPTPKIDFSQFKSGDVVEVELSNEEKRIGWFDCADRNKVVIKTLQRKGNQVCNGGSYSGSKMFNLEKIKLITKIK